MKPHDGLMGRSLRHRKIGPAVLPPGIDVGAATLAVIFVVATVLAFTTGNRVVGQRSGGWWAFVGVLIVTAVRITERIWRQVRKQRMLNARQRPWQTN